jgi:phospholipid-binding lipoprotein MlaA
MRAPLRAASLAIAFLLPLTAAAAAAPAPTDAPPPAAAPASAAAPDDAALDPRVYDPWEPWNRAIFKFNLGLDRHVVRPFARGYRDHVPQTAREGISRFLDNLEGPLNMVNNLLQGKPLRAGSDLLRFVINTTLGIAGFLDPATSIGLTQSDEDFGQTLGRWGVGPGPYVVLPFLPPKDLRDLGGEWPDAKLDPFTYVDEEWKRYGGKAFDYLELRYRLLELDELVDDSYDPYSFVRNAYLERRAYRVRDGAPPVEDGSEGDPYEDPYADPYEDPEPPVDGVTPPVEPPPR